MPSDFDMISAINDGKETWKLAVRVTGLWTVQYQFKASHIEGIFMDKKGDKIQLKTVSADIEYWKEILKENMTYIVHNVGVKPNDLDYKACEHPFRLDLTKGTSLKQREIPENTYKFKDFEEILSGKVSVTQLVDVIGEFHRTIHTQPKPPKNIVIAMRNLSGVMLRCALWGEHATKCLSYTESKSSGPIIILLTQARIRDSEAKYPVSISNSMFGSKLHINENVAAIQEFTASLSSCQHSESQSQSGSQMSSYSQQGLSEQEKFVSGAKEGEEDPKVFPETLDIILGQTLAFHCKAQPKFRSSSGTIVDADSDFIRSIDKVIRLNEGNKTPLEKGKNASSNSDFQDTNPSLSTTADHDPEEVEDVTPVKRRSTYKPLGELTTKDAVSAQQSSTKMRKRIKKE